MRQRHWDYDQHVRISQGHLHSDRTSVEKYKPMLFVLKSSKQHLMRGGEFVYPADGGHLISFSTIYFSNLLFYTIDSHAPSKELEFIPSGSVCRMLLVHHKANSDSLTVTPAASLRSLMYSSGLFSGCRNRLQHQSPSLHHPQPSPANDLNKFHKSNVF